MSHSLWDILQSRWEMWLIVGFSILAVAVGLERLYFQWRYLERARALNDVVSRCLSRGALSEGRSACERSQSPLADVYLVGYERFGRSRRDHLEGAVHRERVRVTADLKNRTWMLGTIGATAPFVGLFGTVLGIMEAFDKIKPALEEMKAKGEEGAVFAVVAPGISVALYATAAGILVAVEAVIIYNYFNQRSARIGRELKLLTEEFLELLEEVTPDEADGPPRRKSSESDATTEDPDDGAREAA